MIQYHVLVYLHIRLFVGEAVQVELSRRLHSAVTGPGFITLALELRNDFDRTPNLIKRSNQSPPRVVAPKCSYEAEHVDVGICHAL